MASSSVPPRLFTAEEIETHNETGEGASFWAVVDGFVCDASQFLTSHPGKLRKLLSANNKGAGATGAAYGFSFSRGRNSHFPGTSATFRDGVASFLSGSPEADGAAGTSGAGSFLSQYAVDFAPHGKLVLLGRLRESS